MLLVTIEPPASSGTATGAPPAEPEPPPTRAGGLLRHHDFRQLFIGDTLSQFGTQLTMLAIPVLAVKVLDAGAFEMGLLATCEFLAFLVIGLPAGAWVDRWRKQRVLVANDLIRAVALGSLPLAWAVRRADLPADAGRRPGRRVLHRVLRRRLPELPARHRRAGAHRRGQRQAPGRPVHRDDRWSRDRRRADQADRRAADRRPGRAELRVVGVLGPSHRARRHPSPARGPSARCVVEVREGLAFVLKHPLLWRITACTSMSNLFSSMSGAMIVLYAAAAGPRRGPARPRLRHRRRRRAARCPGRHPARRAWVGEGRIIPLSTFIWMPAAFLMPLAGTVLEPMVAVIGYMFLITFGVVLYNVSQVSFRQRLCPRPDARPDERLDPLPGLGRDADRRLPRRRPRPPVRPAVGVLDRGLRRGPGGHCRCCSRR